jgi:hypothetical protein
MIYTGNNMQSTGFQSPPGPPSRRLPSVASGERLYDDYSIFYSKTRAGSSLTEPHFGPDNGVHLRILLSTRLKSAMFLGQIHLTMPSLHQTRMV